MLQRHPLIDDRPPSGIWEAAFSLAVPVVAAMIVAALLVEAMYGATG